MSTATSGGVGPTAGGPVTPAGKVAPPAQQRLAATTGGATAAARAATPQTGNLTSTTSDAGARVGRGRGRPARYTLDDLLELVVQVFNDRGYEAASMEDLAKASGLTKSTLYHHVSSKEELLGMAVDRALDALTAVFDDVTMSSQSLRPVDRLQHALQRTTEVLLAELPYVTLLLRVRGNTDVERAALDRRRAVDDRLAALVREAAEAGQIRDDIEPRLVSRLLFGMVNSVTQWYRPASRTSEPQVVRAVVGLAMTGLGAPAHSDRRVR